MLLEAITRTGGATGELDDEPLAHELGAMESWDHITRVHGIFVLDEAKAIHELDLGNLAGAMGVEVVLNVGLGSIAWEVPEIEPRVADARFGHGDDEAGARDDGRAVGREESGRA